MREELGAGVCVEGPTTARARPKGATLVPFVLEHAPYDVMVTGEKRVEIRHKTEYWRARLCSKDGRFRQFDFAEFSHG